MSLEFIGKIEGLDPNIDYAAKLQAAGYRSQQSVAAAASAERLQGACNFLPGDADLIYSTARSVVGVGVVETGMKRFAELLQQVCVDPKPDVIDYAQRFLSDQIRVADTPAAALNVYNIAQSLPHTETRLAIKDHQRLLVNGLYKANVISRSVFLYVFDHDSMEAGLLKMPCDAVKGRREAEICDSIEKLGRHEHLVGPIRRVPLEGHLQDFGEATIGLLMPLYGATLFHVPKSLSYERVAIVGEQVLSALKHLHEGGWCHNDIKASNIFLDKGRAFLGDFGSARRTGEDTPERTMSYVPDDLPTGINVFKASAEVDKVQLAITLLLHTGTLQAPAKGWSISDPVKYGDICKAANDLEDSRLKKLMKSLLL